MNAKDISLSFIPKVDENISMEEKQLSPEDYFVLSRITGKHSVKEIQQTVGFNEEKIRLIFATLIEQKITPYNEPVGSSQKVIKSLEEKKDIDIQKLEKKIDEKLEWISKQEHYSVLGVSKGAHEKAVEHAYFQASKLFHPDRFRVLDQGQQMLKRKLEEAFSGIQESFRILSDPDLKKTYFNDQRKRKVSDQGAAGLIDKAYVNPSGRPQKLDNLTSAQAQYDMGLKEEKKENYKAALNFFKMALQFDASNKIYLDAVSRVEVHAMD